MKLYKLISLSELSICDRFWRSQACLLEWSFGNSISTLKLFPVKSEMHKMNNNK